MAELEHTKEERSTAASLERELHLKHLQINRLLNITQAINDNVSAIDLYAMYSGFLKLEMGVGKMVLLVPENNWTIAASINVDDVRVPEIVIEVLSSYKRLGKVRDPEYPFLGQFQVVIPVLHKAHPIAYALIGGLEEEVDMYNKVQFITTITNIIAVAIENKRLFKRQLEQERLRRELELASEMQKMLVPVRLPACCDYQLASIYKPHLGIGGDYYDFIEFEDRTFAFCVADISGKGVAAALLMANFQANFHTLIKQRQPLEEFIQELNSSVFRITGGDKFLTFFLALVDPAQRTINYINAGHNPPFLVENNRVLPLEKGCTIIGSFSELPEVEVGKERYDSDTMILTYTDGLTDIQNEDKEYLSNEFLTSFLLRHSSLNASTFNQKLMEQIELFKGKENYPDDFTILTCKLPVTESPA